jgi:aspartate/methionine/tyrosine aminotransferase
MSLHQEAAALNDSIRSANPSVASVLSERGKSIYFPKSGILSQTAEAKGKKINATIGSALEDSGMPMHLKSIKKNILLDPKDVFPYAPSGGISGIRDVWRKRIYNHNPSLGDAVISRPVVTSALTHGLSIGGYLFCNPHDEIIIPDLFWGNYRLILSINYQTAFTTFNTFEGDGFNVDGLRAMLMSGKPGKRLVMLNFPNNPTGYTPTAGEAVAIRDTLVEAAETGNDIVVFVDDAYFGLVFEEGIYTESIFALLANAHERIIAVKLDGPTKEDYVWGFRVGFLTFGTQKNNDTLYRALEAKTSGAIRGTISNASHCSQSLLSAAYSDPDYESEKVEKYETLKRRYNAIRTLIDTHHEYSDYFEPLPFNSGYFMCVRIKGCDAETLRQHLLENYDTGVIAMEQIIRIAYSSTPLELLGQLFDNIYTAAKELHRR